MLRTFETICNFVFVRSLNISKYLGFRIEQAEAEVVPRSSLVEVKVEVEVGVEVGVEVEVWG